MNNQPPANRGVATIEKRALEWLLSGDTGVSSKTICAHMLGIKLGWKSPPSDAGDRGRCVRLLQAIPEWQPRLNELADEKQSTGIVIDASGMHSDTNSWSKQIPLIQEELNK